MKAMKINIENHEAFFLDFIEGRLDTRSIAEMETFLSQHPELKKKLESFDQITLDKRPEFYPDKDSLKKFQFDIAKINKTNFSDFCIAWFEHQLNPEKAKELFDYITVNPENSKEFYCFERTYLKPQQKIIFPDKKLLRKKTKFTENKRVYAIWLSIAAGLALFISLYVAFMQQKIKDSVNQTSSRIISTETFKSTMPQYSKVENHKKINYNYNKLFSKHLKNINTTDTLNNYKPFINSDQPSLNEQIAYICPIEISDLEYYNDFILRNSLNNNIKFIDLKDPTVTFRATAFERITKIKIADLKNKNGKLSVIKIAQLGLSGINRLTNSNMRLIEKTDTVGNVIALSFESEAFEYHKIKGNEPK